jgi:multiple sugar transport system permease protein
MTAGERRTRGVPAWAVTAVLAAVGWLVAFPFVWMVRTSFMPLHDAMQFPPIWVPQEVTLRNYVRALEVLPFGRFIFNSLVVASAVTVGHMVTASMSAYAFARLRFPGRDALFLGYLGTIMVPGHVTFVPLFLIMKTFNWIDQYPALIVPQLTSAYLTFLLRQFFLTIPRELEDAAKIDGAGYFRTFRSVFVPLSGPALAAVAIFSFIGSWNSFLWPLIVTNSHEMMTIPVGLSTLSREQGSTVDYAVIMAGGVMGLLPIFVVFTALQRYFVEGVTMTGLKG